MNNNLTQTKNLDLKVANTHDRVCEARNALADKLISKKYLNSNSPLSGISIKPDATFANQNEGERIYVLVRKHWFTNLGWLVKNSFYAMLPFIATTLLAVFKVQQTLISTQLASLIVIIYYSFLFTNVVKLFTDWYYDPFFVTTDRVMDYDFKPYGRYSIGEISLENIVDVRQKSAGFIGDIFNYGTVEVRTENNSRNIIMTQIPNPTLVRDVITDLYKIAKSYPYGDT